MFPYLYQKGSFVLTSFSFMIMLAALLATVYVYWRAKQKKLSTAVVLDLAMIGIVISLIGARLFHVFFESPLYYWEHWQEIFNFKRGGYVSYGALISIIVSWVVYLKWRKIPVYRYLDLMTLAFPIVIFFVRMGCLCAGCCYGKPTDLPFHLIFTNPIGEAGRRFEGIPLHATQIYDMLNAVVIFVILNWADKKKKFDGQIFWLGFMLYGVLRAWVEFFRGDIERGLYWHGRISTAQIVGFCILIVGSLMYRHLKKANGGR